MSFFRPEALTALRRYGEPVAYGVVAAVGIWQGLVLLETRGWVGWVVLAIGALAGLALFGAVERALLAWRSRARGPGVVSVEEGRISYFGPAGGAIMALDALVSVDIVTTADGPFDEDVFWHLRDEMGQQLVVPGGAEDAGRLLDLLGALPGFDHVAVVQAMGSTGPARFRLWSRQVQPLGRSV